VSCDSDAKKEEALFVSNNEESENSSATSGATGIKAGDYSEVSSTPEAVQEPDDNDVNSQDNQDIVVTDKDIEK
jgi:hypothetical protein